MIEAQDGGEPDPRDELTLKQRRAMRVLAQGGTPAQAGRAAGVNEGARPEVGTFGQLPPRRGTGTR